LFAYLREAPHPVVYKLLRKKRIKLNGGRAGGGEMLTAGDALDFYLAPETLEGWRGARAVPAAAALTDIIYEDERLLVVNKPTGLPAHGGMAGGGDHLLARVLYYLYQNGGYDPAAAFTPALCNRLDVNTSGLIICGKTLHILQTCAALFAGGGFDKEYLAVAEGRLHGQATLSGDYYKDGAANTAYITASGNGGDAPRSPAPGKRAVTRYTSLAVSERHSLLRVRPVTGRSHQIRAHLAGIGHPLAGDTKYGGHTTAYAPGQLLHAYRLRVKDPPGSGAANGTDFPVPASWTAPLPEGFARCVRNLFGNTIAMHEAINREE
jgi:23S rRNA pseudouridine955/2504/2580 synthase